MKSMFKKVFLFTLFSLVITLACTVSSLPFSLPFISTTTPTPTNTATATPTATPTETPTPPPTGVQLIEQNDGTTLVEDYDNQYSLVLPEKWVVFALSNEDLSESLNAFVEANPDFADSAEAFESLDPQTVRIVALYADSEHIYQGSAPNVVILAFEDATLASLPLDFITAMMEDSLAQEGFTVFPTTSYSEVNSDGTQTTIVDVESDINSVQGGSMTIHGRYIFFQSNGKLLIVNLTTPDVFTDEMMAVAEAIRDSVTLLAP